RLNGYRITRVKPGRELRRQAFLSSIFADNEIHAGLARLPTLKPVGWKLPPFRQHGHLHFCEKAHFAHDAVSTAILSFTAGVVTERVSRHSDRISVFECLDRRVHRIRHVGVNARNAGQTRTSAHPPADRFVVCDRLVRTWINSTEGE